MSCRWRLSVKRQHGQAVIETTIILPLVVLASLLMVQLIWIAWWQHNLVLASNYALRTGTINSLHSGAMRTTLAAGMTAVQPQLSATGDQQEGNYRRLLSALLRSQLWSQWGARIEVIQPSRKLLNVHDGAIAVDHNGLRYQTSNDQPAYVAARTVELEIWWCMPLHVPLAADALAALRTPVGHAVQRFCQQRQSLSEAPLWGLRYRLKGPLLSRYDGAD